MEALVYHLYAVFPAFSGHFVPLLFWWKVGAFGLCLYLSHRDPRRYLWSTLFAVGTVPIMLLYSEVDVVSLLTRAYLQWTCAEITFRLLAGPPSSRMTAWWLFPLLLLFVL